MKPNLISLSEYIGHTKLPKLLSIEDILKHQVNKESEIIISDEERYTVPPAEFVVIHDKTWKVGWYNFFKSIIP